MSGIKYIFRFLDTTFALFIGMSMVEFFQEGGFTINDVASLVDTKVKIIMAVVGTFYYIINGVHKYQMNKLEREEKKLLNKKLEEELEMKEWENDKKKFNKTVQ